MKQTASTRTRVRIDPDGKAAVIGRFDPETGKTAALVAGRTRQPMHPLLRFARAVSVIAGIAYAITRRR